MDKGKESIEGFNKVADLYQEKFMDLNIYNASYTTFCDLVKKKNAAVFEIGCGPGNITRYLLSKRPDFKLEAIDGAPAMIERAAANNPEAVFKVMDARTIGSITTRFDGIVCGFCIPYLSKEECVQLITDAYKLLNSEGVFYLSVIEGNYADSAYQWSSDGKNKSFVHYYDEGTLRKMLEEQHFKIADVQRVGYPQGKTGQTSHLILLAVKD